jgi:hypothetical protein
MGKTTIRDLGLMTQEEIDKMRDGVQFFTVRRKHNGDELYKKYGAVPSQKRPTSENDYISSTEPRLDRNGKVRMAPTSNLTINKPRSKKVDYSQYIDTKEEQEQPLKEIPTLEKQEDLIQQEVDHDWETMSRDEFADKGGEGIHIAMGIDENYEPPITYPIEEPPLPPKRNFFQHGRIHG